MIPSTPFNYDITGPQSPDAHVYMYIRFYSLVPGVPFDLGDKPDAPKTTVVHVSNTCTDTLHCGYKSIITPHYHAPAVYSHSLPGCRHGVCIPARALNEVL